MRSGKEHAKHTQPIVSNEGPRGTGVPSISGPSSSRFENLTALPDVSTSSNTEPTGPDGRSGLSGESSVDSESYSRIHQEVLVDCNSLVEKYRKGEVLKATVYVEIQSKLTKALGDNRSRSDAAFGSFIATIESHDAKAGAAARRGGAFKPIQRSPSPPISVSDEQQSDEEPVTKKIKVDESMFAWVVNRKGKCTVLRDSLVKTLKLIEIYSVNPRAAKHSLINEPDCPKFPDTEWKNIISGRAVNLDSVLSGQLSTTFDDTKIEKLGDLKISFGAVKPTKVVKNGGDWTIAWNRTVRATVFAFPHRMQELTNYGEYIVNLFSVTHTSVHNRVIAFDKAVRKRVGSVRNLELSDFEKFADLKIAHMGYQLSQGLPKMMGKKESEGRIRRKMNLVTNGTMVN